MTFWQPVNQFSRHAKLFTLTQKTTWKPNNRFFTFLCNFCKEQQEEKVPSLKIENKHLPSVIELSWPENDDNFDNIKET